MTDRPTVPQGLMPAVGALLAGRYCLEEEIGHGATSIVFRALDVTHSRPLAVKVLRPELAHAIGPERFLREIEVTARLTHPHILGVIDSGNDAGVLYYVMPLVQGESLAGRLERDGQLPIADAVQIGAEVADGLNYAHAQGILHRDVKPENILLAGHHAWIADFGIARAIKQAASDRITSSGLVVGTPMYMSPEQAAGHSGLDGRSDEYSLACVLYECLAGVPPFRGATPQTVIAQRFLGPPPNVRTLRDRVAPALAEALDVALSTSAADRFATLALFRDALRQSVERPSDPKAIAALAPAHRRLRQWRTAAWVGVTVVVLAALGAAWVNRPVGAAVDTNGFAVLPLMEDAAQPTPLSGDLSGRLLHESLSRWDGIHLVNDLLVRERLHELPARAGVAERLAMVRELGAGRMVWGSVWRLGDSLHVRATLYDVVARRVVQERSMRVPVGATNVGTRFNALADSLVVDANVGSPSARDGAAGTTNVAALVAYDSAHVALNNWQMDVAARWFGEAARRDTNYAQAHLWHALALSWSDPLPDPFSAPIPPEWREAARAAVARQSRLTPRERLLAAGLLALAEQRYPDACVQFDALAGRDSTDFAAWYGAGDCRRRDMLVARDDHGMWQFRGSYHTAIESYARALRLVPSMSLAIRGIALKRLPEVLIFGPDRLRYGRAADGAWFAAAPGLAHDTITFAPLARDVVLAGGSGTYPESRAAAWDRNRATYLAIASSWVSTVPGNADVRELLASALEANGMIARDGNRRSALTELIAGERLATDTGQRLRMAISRVRLLLKNAEYETAATVADSLLRAAAHGPAEQGTRLAALAALLGQPHVAAELMIGGRQRYMPVVPREEREAYYRAFAFASVGAPRDSAKRAMELASHVVTDTLMRGFLCLAAQVAFVAVGRTALHGERQCAGGYVFDTQRSLAAGDSRGARERLEVQWRARGGSAPSHVSIDAVLAEAHALLLLHDTAKAVVVLDASLDHLPQLSEQLLAQLTLAGALPRAMALRAAVARRTGDDERYRRWSAAVGQLYTRAEAGVRDEAAELIVVRPAAGAGGAARP